MVFCTAHLVSLEKRIRPCPLTKSTVIQPHRIPPIWTRLAEVVERNKSLQGEWEDLDDYEFVSQSTKSKSREGDISERTSYQARFTAWRQREFKRLFTDGEFFRTTPVLVLK